MPVTQPHDPAFPEENYRGLTVREHFAALALQGLLASGHYSHRLPEVAATEAVLRADKLIDALNAQPKPVSDNPTPDHIEP